MTEQEKALWQRIQNFQLDDPDVAFKFSDRLARENGWSISYTKRVIQEYKSFIFLCCVCEHGVTPPDAVDQAWHLHLTFTHSYWTAFCKHTLQKDIHHNPTKGGRQEAQKFDKFYTSSQQLYLEKFGHLPPADIWKDNHTRFTDINFKRVNTGSYWLVPKPRLNAKALIITLLISSPCIFIQATSAIWPIIIMGVVAIAVIGNFKKGDRGSGNNSNGGCSTAGCGGENTHHYNDGHHHSSDGHHNGDSGCNSGCSGCSGSGCSGCGGD